MRIPASTLKALNIKAPKAHGAKVRADKQHGESLCRGLIQKVKLLTGVEGVLNYRFDESSRREFDVAWPSKRLAVELQGWTTHHRREAMERDFVKLASAHRMGWKLYFATTKQAKHEAALWISAEIDHPIDP
jgi:hypothetical protein